jgi:2-dehydropantoate 2-reductase
VKSTLTGSAVDSNRSVFGPNTTVLTLQNGLGNIEQISEQIGLLNVIAGTTAHGATMLGPGKIRHAGHGKTVIGELNGLKSDRLQMITDLLQKAGLETDQSENVLGLIWDKLLVNVGINALTALTGLTNGQLLDHPEIVELLEGSVLEAKQVAKGKGITLHYEDPVAHTKEVCKATSFNKSSMLQDIMNHKQTEINSINGAIVDEGKTYGIKTPINEVLRNLVLFQQKA